MPIVPTPSTATTCLLLFSLLLSGVIYMASNYYLNTMYLYNNSLDFNRAANFVIIAAGKLANGGEYIDTVCCEP